MSLPINNLPKFGQGLSSRGTLAQLDEITQNFMAGLNEGYKEDDQKLIKEGYGHKVEEWKKKNEEIETLFKKTQGEIDKLKSQMKILKHNRRNANHEDILKFDQALRNLNDHLETKQNELTQIENEKIAYINTESDERRKITDLKIEKRKRVQEEQRVLEEQDALRQAEQQQKNAQLIAYRQRLETERQQIAEQLKAKLESQRQASELIIKQKREESEQIKKDAAEELENRRRAAGLPTKNVSQKNRLDYIPIVSTFSGFHRALSGLVSLIKNLAKTIFCQQTFGKGAQAACNDIYHIGRGLLAMIPIVGNVALYKFDQIRITS